MIGRRFYLYLMYINAWVSAMGFIPQILYKNRFGGSISSIILATLTGMLLIVLFQRQMNKFPGQNISQIMKGIFPEWFRKLFLIFNLILMYCNGVYFLVSMTQLVKTYVIPNMSYVWIFIIFLALIVFSSMLQSDSILFMLEFVVMLPIPVYLFIIGKFLTDDLVISDSILEAMTYILHWPNYSSLAAATCIFTGYTPLLIFNKQIRPIPKKHLIIAGVFGFFVLFTCYLIPIGYLGLHGVGKEVFVWLTTTDSMRFENFLVDRTIFILLFFHIGISLMFVILCWHSSLQFLKMIKIKNGENIKWIAIFFFLVAASFAQYSIDETSILRFFTWFLNLRLASDITLMLILWRAAKNRCQAFVS